ncbi:hypothetical protein KP509_28G041900 [Ceratopteris richardii]|uniref:Autophagy-related protein 18a n=1 Tax=Ceratopteris richardii TaxID=49495 RepID=A0A8T2RD74_CERRI|nr:hypothetical protein KP509_28G041900 [Ceratopteris richardii]
MASSPGVMARPSSSDHCLPSYSSIPSQSSAFEQANPNTCTLDGGLLPADSQPISSSQLEYDTCNLDSDLLSLSFNQDYGCFACGTSKGFMIFNCDPFKETFHRDFPNGGIGMVEMLFRCNILALVGGTYPPNKVLLWDDIKNQCIGELSFRSEVRAVRLRKDRIVVVLEHKIYVYNLQHLKLLHQIETIANPRGLCCLSPSTESAVLACLGLHRGQVRVEHYGLKKTKFISAHESQIACFALTTDGQLLATASYKGTLIRIFNSIDGTRLREVRRGADRAEIYSISFSPNIQWLAVSSDKGTVHIFNLKAPEIRVSQNLSKKPLQCTSNKGSVDGADTSDDSGNLANPVAFSGGNPNSTLSFMKGVLPKYFSSEWSFAQFRLPEDVRTLVAFGADSCSVIIVGLDGSFFRCRFDPVNGGEMQQEEFVRFFTADSYIMA